MSSIKIKPIKSLAPSTVSSESTPSLLVLGGTRFVGRAIVAEALARGFRVSMFNRGRTNPSLFPEVECIIGDRTSDMSALAGRRFDVVVDAAAYHPDVVARTIDVLSGAVDRYVFVSTASVYRDHSIPQVEGAELIALDKGESDDEGDSYGARKAACESLVLDAFGDRALIGRSGMIVGPHDPTDRFAYWPRRIARSSIDGGPILAPGDPSDPVQFVDVRDLAGFCLDGPTMGWSGVYNVSRQPMPIGDFLSEVARVLGVSVDLRWASSDWLLDQGVDPWMGVPMWISAPGWESANDLVTTRAVAAGLRIRPLSEIINGVYAWDADRGGPVPGEEGLSAVREAELLHALTVTTTAA